MLPAFAFMAYPIKDTELWQYAVPFLSQNQLIQKITRGESPSPEQWGVYLTCSLALAGLLWLAAVWRYRQEKLALAVKMYKMALDMAPQKFAALKYKIMKNIGHAYVGLREFSEAVAAYEEVLAKFPDFEYIK